MESPKLRFVMEFNLKICIKSRKHHLKMCQCVASERCHKDTYLLLDSAITLLGSSLLTPPMRVVSTPLSPAMLTFISATSSVPSSSVTPASVLVVSTPGVLHLAMSAGRLRHSQFHFSWHH